MTAMQTDNRKIKVAPKSLFDRLREPEGKPDNMCDCSECQRSYRVSQIDFEYEYESWEMPTKYVIHFCPVCEDGGCIESYWYSRTAACLDWLDRHLKKGNT